MKLEASRCFKIPREKLDLFLVALRMNFSSIDSGICRHEMEYVFIAKDDNYYDVIVNRYGSYPYLESELEKFVEALNK